MPLAHQVNDDQFFDDIFVRSTTPSIMSKHKTQLNKYHFIYRDSRSKLMTLKSWYELLKEHSLVGNSTGLSLSLALELFVSVIKNSPQASGLTEDQFCEVRPPLAAPVLVLLCMPASMMYTRRLMG